jgi:hypothetical protein
MCCTNGSVASLRCPPGVRVDDHLHNPISHSFRHGVRPRWRPRLQIMLIEALGPSHRFQRPSPAQLLERAPFKWLTVGRLVVWRRSPVMFWPPRCPCVRAVTRKCILSADNEVPDDTKHKVAVDSQKTGSQKHCFNVLRRRRQRCDVAGRLYLHFALSGAVASVADRCVAACCWWQGREGRNRGITKTTSRSPHSLLLTDCAVPLTPLFLIFENKCASSSFA